ncbi:hypothetical protein HJG60_008621 [Phyllostomus discolor]|uniref:Uncharacterized protein n=1 Tax=Phyllostomus discolor TaxID=89673 RepID=A0A833Z3S3_9CHIR|nr:hypothetical protein HJG60_008621 [Phyllostomus discolor]
MAAIHTVWVGTGDVPDTVSKWQSYVDLVQIVQEISMCQVMFNPNFHGPSDDCFMARMRNIVRQHASSASFGSLTAILAWMSGAVLVRSPQWWQVWERGEVAATEGSSNEEPTLSLRQKATLCI